MKHFTFTGMLRETQPSGHTGALASPDASYLAVGSSMWFGQCFPFVKINSLNLKTHVPLQIIILLKHPPSLIFSHLQQFLGSSNIQRIKVCSTILKKF